MTHKALKTQILSVWPQTFPLVVELLSIAAEFEARQPGRWYVLGCCSPTTITSARRNGLVFTRNLDEGKRTQVRLSPKGRQLLNELSAA
jgi:hypothetical protein